MKTSMDTTVEIEISPGIKEKLQLCKLYDFYGPLLTEKQNTCFVMYYLEDLSMAEAGEILGVTPQAVADQIKRTVKKLQWYENKLSLVKKANHAEKEWQVQNGI